MQLVLSSAWAGGNDDSKEAWEVWAPKNPEIGGGKTLQIRAGHGHDDNNVSYGLYISCHFMAAFCVHRLDQLLFFPLPSFACIAGVFSGEMIRINFHHKVLCSTVCHLLLLTLVSVISPA